MGKPTFGRYIAPCLRCGAASIFTPHHRTQICDRKRCQPQPLDLSRAKRRPTRTTHIAGYVPPSGSVAWSLLGNVVRLH